MNLELYLNELNSQIDQKNGQLKEKVETMNKKSKENEQLENLIKLNSEKKLLLQEACNTARKVSYDLFSNIATNGLQSILGDNIFVEITSGEKNSVPTADFVIKTKYDDYETITDPTEADGGGVADIVSLSALICMNILNGSKNTAPLFLDEPTKYVSAGYATDVAQFIKDISLQYDKQIIMVTHALETKYAADKVFEIELDGNGVSVVKESTNIIEEV